MWNNAINAWWPLLFYPATDAPRFTKGMYAMIGTCIATLGVTALVWYLERREWRLKGRPGAPGRSVRDAVDDEGERVRDDGEKGRISLSGDRKDGDTHDSLQVAHRRSNDSKSSVL